MKKLILPLLSLAVLGAAAPALSAADRDDCGPAYTVTRTWVEGHWERDGRRREEWVPGHWVETRREAPPEDVVVVRDRDRDHDWRDDHRGEWRDRDEHEHRSATVVAPLPIPLPLPIPFPFFGHH